MRRRDFMSAAALSVVSAALRPTLRAQDSRFRELRSGVGIFEERGGTIGWFISPDGSAVVDSQFPDTAGHCLDEIRQRSSRRLDALFNTHHHGDHTAGNGVFAGFTERIVSHRRVPMLQKRAASQQADPPEQAYPGELFDREFTMKAGPETILARHYGPAHTSGDSVVYFERANVVHMGDLVFNRSLPFIDRDSGASIAGWVTTLDQVKQDFPDDVICIFGHGSQKAGVIGNKGDLQVQRDFLSALLEHARKGIQSGRSREDIVNQGSLPGFPDHEPMGTWLTLPKVLEVAYLEVTQGVVSVD